MKPGNFVQRFSRSAAWVCITLFSLGVASFASVGEYARYWADDYCYSTTVKQYGLFPALVNWWQTSGNRLSTLAAVWLSDLFGRDSIRYIPAVVLGLQIAAWIFFFYALRRWRAWKVSMLWGVLAALVQVYFGTLLAPDRLQTVYWRMGTYHYTLPLAFLLLNAGLVILWSRQPGWGGFWKTALVSGFLAFFAAGLSETFAALQAGLVGLGLVAAVLFLRGASRAQGVRLLVPPLVGSAAMMGIMMLAPANAWRQAVMPPPDNLLLVLPYSLRYAFDFIRFTIRGQLTPFVVYGAAAALLTLAAFSAARLRLSLRQLLIGAAVSLGLMYALIVCSFAPSAYAGLAYPAGRALMPGSFVLLAGLGAAAGFLALALRAVLPVGLKEWLPLAALVALILVSLYPFRSLSVVRRDIDQLSPRAERWDARNAEILAQMARGESQILVKQTDVVQNLEDIGPDPTQWVNICAADFYGVQSITANP